MYSSFEDLEVWQRSCTLAVDIYGAMKVCRDFGLRDQMTRAAVSIASNIAEGAERDSVPEYIRFLHIAKGSAAELRTQLVIATRIGIVPEALSRSLREDTVMISRQLHGLIQYLKRMKQK